MNYAIRTDGELYHHGILGQKWGVRRYQNSDGSLTTAGKAHYAVKTVGEHLKKTGEAAKKGAAAVVGTVSKYHNKDGSLNDAGKARFNKFGLKRQSSRMTDAELRNANNRLMMENQYRQLQKEQNRRDRESLVNQALKAQINNIQTKNQMKRLELEAKNLAKQEKEMRKNKFVSDSIKVYAAGLLSAYSTYLNNVDNKDMSKSDLGKAIVKTALQSMINQTASNAGLNVTGLNSLTKYTYIKPKVTTPKEEPKTEPKAEPKNNTGNSSGSGSGSTSDVVRVQNEDVDDEEYRRARYGTNVARHSDSSYAIRFN